jgi:RNA polymerase sigma-70 factor (ECF subfamily)
MQKDTPPEGNAQEVRSTQQAPARAPLSPSEHAIQVEKMFREHNDSLLRFLRARLHSQDEAKEVAQEAYVQMLGLDNPAAVNYMQGYLFRTAANIATNRLKSGAARRRIDQIVFFDIPHDSRTPQHTLDMRQQLANVSEALERLPPLCRRAFILVRYEGMSVDDAAAEMGLHPRKVRRFVQRAFLSCQRALTR